MVKLKKEKVATKKKIETKAKRAAAHKVVKAKPKATPAKSIALKVAKKVIPKRKPAIKKEKITLAKTLSEKPVEAVVIPKIEPVIPKKEILQPILKEKVKEVKKETFVSPAKKVSKPEPLKVEREAEVKPAVAVELKELELEFPVTVKGLAVRLQEKPSIIIKTLMDMGVMVVINQTLEETTVIKLCQKYGYKIKKALDAEELALQIHQ